jgi:hypothetical protein
MGEMRKPYKDLVGKPEWKRPFRRSGRIWEENITMHLTEIGWEAMEWKHLAQDRDQWWAVVKGRGIP